MRPISQLPLSTSFTVEQALESALTHHRLEGLQDVMVIAYDKDGDLFVCSSQINRAEALFLIERARNHALTPPTPGE